MMGVPLQCAAFLTQHEGLLQEAHSANAKYLFQKDKLNVSCTDAVLVILHLVLTYHSLLTVLAHRRPAARADQS